jgi:integrase
MRHLLIIAPQLIAHSLWMIMATGGRVKDLQRLRRSQLHLTTRHLHVQWRWTKTTRRRRFRRNVKYPLSWAPPLQESLRTAIQNGPGEARLFSQTAVANINAWLVPHRAEPTERLTTYSFRRLFIHQLMNRFHGDIDRCILYTGHFGRDMINAHYTRWRGDTDGFSDDSDHDESDYESDDSSQVSVDTEVLSSDRGSSDDETSDGE